MLWLAIFMLMDWSESDQKMVWRNFGHHYSWFSKFFFTSNWSKTNKVSKFVLSFQKCICKLHYDLLNVSINVINTNKTAQCMSMKLNRLLTWSLNFHWHLSQGIRTTVKSLIIANSINKCMLNNFSLICLWSSSDLRQLIALFFFAEYY